MQLTKDAVLLRIFIGEKDRYDHKPLYEEIVAEARRHHMAGATVLRGPMGFGHSSYVHRANFLEISENLPLVIEIVDTQDKIDTLLPTLDAMMTSGLITMEKVQVISYGVKEKK